MNRGLHCSSMSPLSVIPDQISVLQGWEKCEHLGEEQKQLGLRFK
jgi:hypothetical protein